MTLVPDKDSAVLGWMRGNGYDEYDLRSDKEIDTRWMNPMQLACRKGELNVCKWLYNHGAAEDITRINKNGFTPMHRACKCGHLSVCQWLFDMGATADITKADNVGRSPMYFACQSGHLSVCQWLFDMGAAADISKTDERGGTPMHQACETGHLLVCQWLYEVGAVDITKIDNIGNTPLRVACRNGRLPLCKWLILNGALNNPATEYVDHALVENETRCYLRPALKRWALSTVAVHQIFLNTFLRASVLVPTSQLSSPPSAKCRLPNLPKGVLIYIGKFVGVETGRQLRNVKGFLEVLLLLLNNT